MQLATVAVTAGGVTKVSVAAGVGEVKGSGTVLQATLCTRADCVQRGESGQHKRRGLLLE